MLSIMTEAKNSTGTDSSELQAKVRAWLISDGYLLHEDPAPGAAWAVVAVDPAQRQYAIGQALNRPDVLIIQNRTQVDTAHNRALQQFPGIELESLKMQMRLRLVSLGVDFEGIDAFKVVTITDVLFPEELTRTDFSRTLRRVRNGMLIVMWTIAEAIGQPVPELAPDGRTGPTN